MSLRDVVEGRELGELARDLSHSSSKRPGKMTEHTFSVAKG